MSSEPFAPLDGGQAPKRQRPLWTPLVPVPKDAPQPPDSHPHLGRPTATWRYPNAGGQTLCYVLRFDTAEGKAFRPLSFAQPSTAGRRPEWRWESLPPKRPLYGLDRLAERPAAPVVVTEGEKACDAAGGLLPGFVAVTSPNGSKNAGKADWSPLRGRHVTVWPDADSSGRAYALTVAKQAFAAGALSVAIVSPPPDCAAGWDAADAVAQGWHEALAGKLIAAAVPAETTIKITATAVSSPNDARGAETDGDTGSRERRRTRQRDRLIGLTEFCELWHDANHTAYVSFHVNGHREHWPARSREFKMWLSHQFYEATGAAIGGQALEDGLRILQARAIYSGPQYEPFLRVGHHDGKLYLDLCDAQWRAIEIVANGWRVIDRPPVKLLRSPSMRPLPKPETGSMLEELRRFVMNVRTDNDFMMTVAWIVGTLHPRGPYTILVINGEHGSGKSTFCNLISSLLDPNEADTRSMSRDERELVIAARHRRILAFDNLSSVSKDMSDNLCRLAYGTGVAYRELHSDHSEIVFKGARPIMLNGITLLTERPDLADRVINIHLAPFAGEDRRTEEDLWADFEQARPRILGALMDAISAALRNLATVRMDHLPRMADFAKWVTAAEPALGWEARAFLSAYQDNRRAVSDAAFEADIVAVAIRDFAIGLTDRWEDTATKLLEELTQRASENVRNSRQWPLTAQALGNRIERLKPLFKSKGLTVERRHSTIRTITILPYKSI